MWIESEQCYKSDDYTVSTYWHNYNITSVIPPLEGLEKIDLYTEMIPMHQELKS